MQDRPSHGDGERSAAPTHRPCKPTNHSIITSQALDSGKKPEVVEKMVEGRLRKYFEEVCLTMQSHMVEEGNPKVRVCVFVVRC